MKSKEIVEKDNLSNMNYQLSIINCQLSLHFFLIFLIFLMTLLPFCGAATPSSYFSDETSTSLTPLSSSQKNALKLSRYWEPLQILSADILPRSLFLLRIHQCDARPFKKPAPRTVLHIFHLYFS